jgi:predicted deacylase
MDPYGVDRFDSGADGPTVAVIAITHGDEIAGLQAYEFLRQHYHEQKPHKGRVVLIKENVRAFILGRRCVTHDMNRIYFPDGDERVTDEMCTSEDYQRAQEMKPVLEGLDYAFAIHSTSKPSTPFSIMEPVDPNTASKYRDILRKIPVDFYSYGWKPFVAGATNGWVDDHGGVGVAVECGEHTNPNAGDIAVRSAKIFLQHLGVDDFGEPNGQCDRGLQILSQEHVKDPRSFAYTKDYNNCN